MTEVAQALRDKTAVCGVGLTLGDFPEKSALQLSVEAYQLALDDAGLKREDVDGIIHRLREHAHSGDVIAIFSNGGFDNIHKRLLSDLS